MRDKKSSIFVNKGIKNVIVMAVPVVITILATIATYLKNDTIKGIITALMIVLALIYAVATYYYGKFSKNKLDEKNALIEELQQDVRHLKEKNKELENKNIVQSDIIATFQELSEEYANNINKIAKSIQEKGIVEVKNWDLQTLSDEICKACLKMLKSYTGFTSADISVGFIKNYNNKAGKKCVKMIACSDPSSSRPHIYGVEEALENCVYYYKDIIEEANPDVVVIADKLKVQQLFKKKNRNTDISKYSQYVAVPIICSENKIQGILQVDIKNDKKIKETEAELMTFSKAYIMPYGNLLLLIHKIEKGLLAQAPSNTNKG